MTLTPNHSLQLTCCKRPAGERSRLGPSPTAEEKIDMRTPINRRSFLAGVAALVGAAWSPSRGEAQTSKTRLILLGTGGGPRPRKASSASAQVIVTNKMAYVVDCGNGVARQLAFAGVPRAQLRHVFITHHHSDHNADYGNLIRLA